MTEYRNVFMIWLKNCLPTQTMTKIIKFFVPESQSLGKQECHTIAFILCSLILHNIIFSTVKRYFSVSIEDLILGEKTSRKTYILFMLRLLNLSTYISFLKHLTHFYTVLFYRLDTKADIIIGDNVVKLHPDDSYNIHFPFKKVRLTMDQIHGHTVCHTPTHLCNTVFSYLVSSLE